MYPTGHVGASTAWAATILVSKTAPNITPAKCSGSKRDQLGRGFAVRKFTIVTPCEEEAFGKSLCSFQTNSWLPPACSGGVLTPATT